MVKKPSSLGLSRLTCQIPNYKSAISELTKIKHESPLYVKFIEKFLAYVPVDYNFHDKISLFGEFCDEAFNFFKNKGSVSRKIVVSDSTFGTYPAISIMLINQNKPFIIDSLICLLTKLGLQARLILHPVIACMRSASGDLTDISDNGSIDTSESLVFMKILGTFDQSAKESFEHEINNILNQLDSTFNSWQKILDNISLLTAELTTLKSSYDQSNIQVSETIAFLEWLKDNNFTFLGGLDFNIENSKVIASVGAATIWENNLNEITEIINFSSTTSRNNKSVILGKINKLSPIHRNSLIDYVLVKKLNEKGEYYAGTIIFGLYSQAIYYQSIKNIPILREKLQFVLEKAGFSPNGYNSKKLKSIIESLPREAVIQIEEGDLFCMCLQMLSSMLSKKLKVFIQHDWSETFINVLIFLPRLRLTPSVHSAINKYLSQKFGGQILSDYVTEVAQDFSHLSISIEIKEKQNFITDDIEEDLDKISTLWNESFFKQYAQVVGEYQAGLELKTYDHIFSDGYRHKFSATEAIIDLNYLKLASQNNKLLFNLESTDDSDFSLKIYSAESKLALSDILPSIENLGFKAIDEQTFTITQSGEIKNSWIYQFILSSIQPIEGDLQELKSNVEDALDKMAQGLLANDSLSKLVVLSGFNWRKIKLLKALTRYLHQTGFTYGKGYVQLTLIKHNKFTELLDALFDAKFNPELSAPVKATEIGSQIIRYLDDVDSSAEDKVLRQMLHLINAIVRTNFYQLENGLPKSYISFKFNSKLVPDLPRPVPYAEIYVFSNDFEGIHLRGGKVARGGLRWSDRGEDYRTEVLGLMKAQMTKNAVIVPVGSKGGFFPLFNSDNLTRPEYMAKIIDCYKNFLRGLLDITDNIVEGGGIISPARTVILDALDPYLVVAADKGTASFSDYANSVSLEYNFWLGDAFASGGSAGYDHKKIGITAKGSWISVQRHFQEIGIDVQKDPITVVGIGDMSGDVFGNGLLRSETIELVAAFNHMHIFIDPTPNAQVSFAERKRLFDLPGSKWTDYNLELISAGGRIFARSAKMIALTPEIKKLLNIDASGLSPEDLIKAILKAKVDLIWNGGIGTYVKASTENHFEIGDKTNDALRCDGKDIQAKVIAEGGNLGVSQQGRIEYCRYGGRINTDFIDNSAGVDCSDHEVNIKIALNQAVVTGKITLEERNKLLFDMTDQVEQLVLLDNYKQTQAITIAALSQGLTVETFAQVINELEEEKLLDRAVEFLPTEAELNRRAIAKERMARPELAVLLSYSKMSVLNELVSSKLTEDPYFEPLLMQYFPKMMQDNFQGEIASHPLRKEIIRTIITNNIVNQLGGSIISTLKRETGASIDDIMSSYHIVLEIFGLDRLWLAAESLPTNVNNNVKVDMFGELAKITRRGISWFVRNLDHPINIIPTINEFKGKADYLNNTIKNLLVGEAKIKFDKNIEKYKNAGIDDALADSIANLDSLISVFDIIYVAKHTTAEDLEVASLYFATGNKLGIDWLRKACEKLIDDSYWNKLSIQSLKDDFYDKQRRLLIKIINQSSGQLDLDKWISNNFEPAKIFIDFVESIKLHENINLNMIILANKKFEMFLRKLK